MFHDVWERYSMTYEPSTEQLPVGNNVTLLYYLQSWRYFRDVEPALRRDLTFRKDIINKVIQYSINVLFIYIYSWLWL